MIEKSLSEILLERRNAAPRDPEHAAADFIYVLARELLRREVRRERAAVVRDFEEAARKLTEAAVQGATIEEQSTLLRHFAEKLGIPEADFRKRREPRGPTDLQLRREVEDLSSQITPILRRRKNLPSTKIRDSLRALEPRATPRALKEAARLPPREAACELIGSCYDISGSTVRNRISRARRRT